MVMDEAMSCLLAWPMASYPTVFPFVNAEQQPGPSH
jgi:hypothetical protein